MSGRGTGMIETGIIGIETETETEGMEGREKGRGTGRTRGTGMTGTEILETETENEGMEDHTREAEAGVVAEKARGGVDCMLEFGVRVKLMHNKICCFRS